MKIDRNKIKKGTSEVPTECKALIERLKSCGNNQDELLSQLQQVKTWNYGKCELYHWADILDLFDDILEVSCKKESDNQWALPCDLPGNEARKALVLQVLQFTALLIEHSFTRHLYSSMEHLTMLMSSSDMTVVLGVLNLLYVFSKRSNFITRLNPDRKQALVVRLTHLAESWGGKENGFGLAECCQDLSYSSYPSSATTLHFEFYAEQKEEKSAKKSVANVLSSIHMESLDTVPRLASHIMEDLLSVYSVPEDKKILLFTHIRLAKAFSNHEKRVQCVQARLQAISILVYSSSMADNVNSLLYSGFIEELVDILEIKSDGLVEIKAAALKTLTSVIHLDRNPKLQSIVDATGAASYHGFLPVLVRTCIEHMTDAGLEPFPQPFVTSLFSFLYHLASYESGGEALVSCGMMESLLRVVNWFDEGQEHITFVTRAVRVVDLITNLDMQAFQTHSGLSTFINRLEHEVNICRKEQPYVIDVTAHQQSLENKPDTPASPPASLSTMETSMATMETTSNTSEAIASGSLASPSDAESHAGAMETDVLAAVNEGASTSTTVDHSAKDLVRLPNGKYPQCFPQRAALLKSMLNFLKKAIPDPAFSDSIRHLMEGSLPASLKHVISNAEYYGPSLFLLASDVVTVYVFQEPSLLSPLQDNGLTDVVLQALLVKDVPATREVLASLPNVFSSLCLNARGLESFVKCKPFERLFKVLLSPDYLPAMRRRRSSDPPGDTASNLGSAMDELMRHQPSLKTEATKAIIKLLEEVGSMGSDPKFICQKLQPKAVEQAGGRLMTSLNNLGGAREGAGAGNSSDEEEEDEDMGAAKAAENATENSASHETSGEKAGSGTSEERKPIPLMDYVLNVMKFVEAILSNNTTDDHCREFITQQGLRPLMTILGMPNLPIEFPTTPSCQAVSAVCKSILTLAHEPQVLEQGLISLNNVLSTLDGLHRFVDAPGGSVLLHELASAQGSCDDPTLTAVATPMLHSLTAAHAYVSMFTHVCKVGQSDIRNMSVNHWGSDLGQQVLANLSRLYTSLVWESTILLAFCSEEVLPADSQFGEKDLQKLLPKDSDPVKEDAREKSDKEAMHMGVAHVGEETGSNGVRVALESLTTHDSPGGSGHVPMETQDAGAAKTNAASASAKEGEKEGKKDKKLSPQMQAKLKHIKPLLNATSRLGKALSELFGLLVKLSVGSPVRQRRAQLTAAPTAPTQAARHVAGAVTRLLASGLNWEPPEWTPVPKLRLTFYICTTGFISPMLFDEKKYPYHLMLQKFVSCGGMDAMFDTFRWALTAGGKAPLEKGLEHPDLPDGTGEFLDSWLLLVEKMVNVKNVLESPHTITAKAGSGLTPFSPVQFLVSTHKMAFEAVMYLWGRAPLKTFGRWMSESILAILCEIIKGQSVITEKLEKEKESKESKPSESVPAPVASSSAAPAASVVPPSRPQEPQVNQVHLQSLIDMGFSREACIEALTHTSSLEQATEYVLLHPNPPPPPAASGVPAPFDMDMIEDEEQMMRAIAMSLGQSFAAMTGQTTQEATPSKPKEEKKEEPPTDDDTQKEEDPLTKEELDQFTLSMFPGCMQLVDAIPESVYRICDLLAVVTSRNGESWRGGVVTSLLGEVAEQSLKLIEAASPLTTADKRSVHEWAAGLSSMDESAKLATRLHLLTLLLQEMKLPVAKIVEEQGILDLLVRLLDAGSQCLGSARQAATPKWVSPLLLMLDLYEKIATASKRRADLEKIVGKTHIWKWFDDRTGRWCVYSNSNNKTIDDAFVAGESSVRFTASRRRYTVTFSTMVQVNEETGNRRAVMLSLPSKELPPDKASAADQQTDAQKSDAAENKTPAESKEETTMETDDSKKEESIRELIVIGALRPDNIGAIIRSCVSLIGKPVDPESLHACMRLSLRLTRDHHFASMFAELGGTRLILSLTQASSFQGFTSLATHIFRHVLEESTSLKQTMEKMIRSSTTGQGSSSSGVATGSIGSKEMHYVLRVLGPAACREPQLFSQVARSCLRIALPPPAKKDEDEARLTGPNAVQIIKCMACRHSSTQCIEGQVKVTMQDLLNVLAKNHVRKETSKDWLEVAVQEIMDEIVEGDRDMEILARATGVRLQRIQDAVQRQGSAASEESPTTNSAPATTSQDSKDASSKDTAEKEAKDKLEEEKKSQPLMPKSAVLRLLAELVRAYAGCALMITQHSYHAGQSELINQECTALSFILDSLLPQCQEAGDKDCPALSKVLIASIAASNHSPEAQSCLVGEIKTALQRALAVPESSEKHARVQALTAIISTVMESCSAPGALSSSVFKHSPQTNNMNNMVKLLLKKGLVTDLARIPHSLDLSSPNMANTMNAALRPLETLSRIVNQPQTVTSKTNKAKATGAVVEPPVETQPPAETEETAETTATSSEVQIEDVTAEALQQAGLEETHQENVEEPVLDNQQVAAETALEEVLDQLLQREEGNPEDEVLGELLMEGVPDRGRTEDADHNVIVEIEAQEDDDGNDDDDDDNHDSQMVTQDISDEEDNTQGLEGDEGVDTEGEHDNEDIDDDDADDDVDDDDDDDEDDDEDDEEGSDMEGDDDYGEDNYLNELTTDDDLYVQLEDMLPPDIIFGNNIQSLGGLRTFQLPIAMHDTDNGNEASGLSIPPAPNSMLSSHPLLVRQPDAHPMGGSLARGRGMAIRNRSAYRGTQTLVHYIDNSGRTSRLGHTSNSLLQSLLGPSIGNMISSNQAAGNARLHFITHDCHRQGDHGDLFDELLQDPFFDEDASSGGVLSSVPSALTRWTEEAKVLDGDTVHDCVLVLKPEVVAELEKHRDVELAERKEKRRKQAEEELAKKEKLNKEKQNKNESSSEAKAEDKDDDKTIEWGTPPEVPAVLGITTSEGSSFTTASSTNDVSAPLAQEESSQREPNLSELDSQISQSELDRAMLNSVDITFPSDNLSAVAAVSETPAVPEATISSSVVAMETPAQQVSADIPQAPIAQRNFAGALGLGLSNAAAAMMPANTPPSARLPFSLTPMDTTPAPAGMITPPSESVGFQPAVPLPMMPDVSDIPLPAGQPSQDAQATPNPPSELAEGSLGGRVTPEQPSDITSSDNVTVNSSPISTEPPSGEHQPVSMEAAVTSGGVTGGSDSGAVATSAGGASASQANAGSIFGGLAVPDGVDPSFLAALPENIRQEVIAEQLRLQRIQQRAQEQQQQAQQLGVSEVNPEFLAALPPTIQEEVLAQQRAEQARLTAESSRATEAAEAPVDPAGFIQSLPSALRQQVLADMDDSMVALLPPDMATEANLLRRDLEDRHRRIMQQRLFQQGGSGPLSALLRQSGLASRLGSTRYTMGRPPSSRDHWMFSRAGARGQQTPLNSVKLRGRHLLDHEALACLLVMLFVDEPRLQTTRLHRVLRNLCYHAPTRAWVIRALLSILHRTAECKPADSSEDRSVVKLKKKGSQPTPSSVQTLTVDTPSRSSSDPRVSQPAWLSISLDAALGCRANVFQLQQRAPTGKRTTPGNTHVCIHPQASVVVCRHVLDALISLAKSFPSQFLPQNKAKETTCGDKADENKDTNKNTTLESKPSSVHTSPAKSGLKSDSKSSDSKAAQEAADFWELLVKLDHQSGGRKGKSVQRSHGAPGVCEDSQSATFDSSPLGQLMSMLAHPVMRRSQVLTDRLLRLLGLVSSGLQDLTKNSAASTTTTTTTTTTTSSANTAPNTSVVTSTSVISSTTGPTSQPRVSALPQPGPNSRADDTLTEIMDFSSSQEHMTSTPLPGKGEKDSKEEDKVSVEKAKEAKAEEAVLESQLQLAVQVLTSKACSEEGLEDATNLLLQLSRANVATRNAVLQLLMNGARELGLTVCAHIRQLIEELRKLTGSDDTIKEEEEREEDKATGHKGVVKDRFENVAIVVAAPKKLKNRGRELQLPSMTLLTSKTSNQQFLLRILKVIIQLRDAAKTAAKKAKAEGEYGSVSEAMAMQMMDIMELTQERSAPHTAGAGISASSQPQAAVAGSSCDPSASAAHPPPATPVTGSPPGSGAGRSEAPMDVDAPSTSSQLSVTISDGTDRKSVEEEALPRLSEQLRLEELWETLGECLTELARTRDQHAVLVLQPAVEAFFLVHAGEKNEKKRDGDKKREDQLAHLNVDFSAPMSPAPPTQASGAELTHSISQMSGISRQDSAMSSSVISVGMPPDTQKFLRFAETHRTVLNQILRQSTGHLADGPFSVLVDHTRVLDFDVKRRYFRQELDRMDEGRGMRREDLAVHVKREHVFEDSFRELLRKTVDDWKHRFYIVFEGEEGQDAGGLIREWYLIMSREIFNPNYALFMTSPGDRVTYAINPLSYCNSNHLSYFKFVGRFLAKAIYDNKLLECYFTRSFYKHILGKPVRYTDMESEDYSFYQGLVFLLENDVKDLGYDLTFSTDIQEFGVSQVRELKPGGQHLPVSEDNKKEYVKLVCQEKMTGAIRQQLNAFLEGFYDIIPKRLISIFNEQEIELLMSGLPTLDIDDLKANTEYHKYQTTSLQIQWFWRALRSFDQNSKAAFLQFVTGTSKVPLQGFSHLEGMNGTQKFQIHRDDRSTDRLPCAHTCFNQLDLPAYETYDKLRHMLLLATHECSEGFGLA